MYLAQYFNISMLYHYSTNEVWWRPATDKSNSFPKTKCREISWDLVGHFEWPHPVHRLGPGNLSVNPVNTDFGCRIYAVFKNYEYGPVTMIAPASGHQVRCIPWVHMGTFNKEIGFLCGLKNSLRWIYFVRNTYNRVYIWCCKYGENRCCERCANK